MPEAGVFSALVTQTWQVAAVAGMVWLMARLFATNRPRLAHALWMLVLLKALTPPIWSCAASPFSWLAMERPVAIISTPNAAWSAIPVQNRSPDKSKAVSPETSEAPPVGQSNTNEANCDREASWAEYLTRLMPSRTTLGLKMARIWMVGAAGGFLLLAVRYVAVLRKLRNAKAVSIPDVDALLNQLSQRLGIRRRVRLLVLEDRIGPVVLGLFNPTIVLPAMVVRGMNQTEISLLLAHELTHLKRGDMGWALVQALAKHLLWFHPLVHWAERCVTQEAEHCCDEEVVQALDCNPVHYARCLLKVLEYKHQLHSIPALPGVRPVDITLTRLEKVMNLRQGSRQLGPVVTWLVLTIGCVLLLPGAGLSWAQEKSADKTADSATTAKSSVEREPAPSALPKLTGPFGKFQESLKRFGASTPTSAQPPLTLKTTMYSLSETETEEIDIGWSQYQEWGNDESGLKQKLLDAQKVTTIVYNNPTKYAELDSIAYERLVQQVNQGSRAREISVPTIATSGTPVALLSAVESDFEAGTLEIANQPGETRTIVRTFKTGLDLHVSLNVVNEAKVCLETNFSFSDVANVTPFGNSEAAEMPAAKPSKPNLIMKLAISRIECSVDKRLALLVTDGDEQPWLAIFEFAPAAQASTPQSQDVANRDNDAPQPEFVVSCCDDDLMKRGNLRTIKYFGHELAVTESVRFEQESGRIVLSGSNIRFSRKGVDVVSADEGQLTFTEDGQAYSMKLKGNAKFWFNESVLNQAHEIDASYNVESQSWEFRGAVQITSAEPIYDGDEYAYPDITADRVWLEDARIGDASRAAIHCAGNVRIVEKNVDGPSTVTEASEVKLIPGVLKPGFGTKFRIEIVEPKLD